jgi:hypothetical protein
MISNPVEKRFGEKIVAAWFETVINPALQALSWEQERLSKKSWTWQFMPGRLESIRYVSQMIPAGYAPNLEQFKKYHPTISENITFHDGEVAQLRVACKNLESAILESGALEKVFARVTTDEALTELGKSLGDMFVGAEESQRLGWIAQEIINGAEEIPIYFGHAPLWNRHRNEFMRVLGHPEVSYAKTLTDRTGEKLLHTVNRLIELLTDTRDQLSLEYDVPPVPAASMVVA